MSKKKSKKRKAHKQPSTKHLRAYNYNPEEALRLLSGGYMNYTLKQFLALAKQEMDIKNHLYSFIIHKGLMDEYLAKQWEKERNKK